MGVEGVEYVPTRMGSLRLNVPWGVEPGFVSLSLCACNLFKSPANLALSMDRQQFSASPLNLVLHSRQPQRQPFLIRLGEIPNR
jgi:hypothetical protein